MKLCLNFVHINFVTFMKRIGQMKGVSKHGNEHSTFSAHFSTMGRIKLREIKLSLHFVHSSSKEKSVVFSVTRPTPFPGFQNFLHSSSYQKPLCHVVVIFGVEFERREECCF
jgi:hypothetical protein